MLIAARLAIRFVPTDRILAWSRRPPKRINRFGVNHIGFIAQAVDDIGSRSWMRMACLPRALAAHAMLRRRGITSRLCLDVAPAHAGLSAHAWIELGHKVVVEDFESSHFVRLIEFGGAKGLGND